MLPGECLCSGAKPACPDCGVTVELQVLHSAAGYYIGTMCNCGPYTRESLHYWRTAAGAQAAYDTDGWYDRSDAYRRGVVNGHCRHCGKGDCHNDECQDAEPEPDPVWGPCVVCKRPEKQVCYTQGYDTCSDCARIV